jgi:tripartite-type tricarboxylate transporter receptor subunit TctC
MTTMKTLNAAMILLWAALTYSGVANAQAEPLTFLTTYQAVGSSSRTASIITPKLEEYLQRPIELEFGAGARAALDVPGDGNTIFISTVGNMALLPAALPSFDLDPLTDLRPVSLLTATPDVLIVHSGLGINTLDELVAYAHEHPGELSYSHIAPRSIHRVEFSALLSELGIDATLDESLRGSAPAMEAVANGRVDLVISTSPYVAPLVDSGAAVALVVAHSSRIPLLPGVPTMLERGITSVPHGSWAGLFVPAGTSDQDLAEVFAAVEFAMADPSVIAQINDLGMEISLSDSPQAYADYLEAEGVRLRNAVEKYQIDLE